MLEEQFDGGDVVPVRGRPQAMIRIGTALQQMFGQVQILASGDCVPKRCRLPVLFAECLLVDIPALSRTSAVRMLWAGDSFLSLTLTPQQM
jgi:hypothetical protein